MKKTLLEQIIREELHSVHEQLGAVVPVYDGPSQYKINPYEILFVPDGPV